jgi:hypothetical protein
LPPEFDIGLISCEADADVFQQAWLAVRAEMNTTFAYPNSRVIILPAGQRHILI